MIVRESGRGSLGNKRESWGFFFSVHWLWFFSKDHCFALFCFCFCFFFFVFLSLQRLDFLSVYTNNYSGDCFFVSTKLPLWPFEYWRITDLWSISLYWLIYKFYCNFPLFLPRPFLLLKTRLLCELL